MTRTPRGLSGGISIRASAARTRSGGRWWSGDGLKPTTGSPCHSACCTRASPGSALPPRSGSLRSNDTHDWGGRRYDSSPSSGSSPSRISSRHCSARCTVHSGSGTWTTTAVPSAETAACRAGSAASAARSMTRAATVAGSVGNQDVGSDAPGGPSGMRSNAIITPGRSLCMFMMRPRHAGCPGGSNDRASGTSRVPARTPTGRW